jgi:tRNA pseudouridine13 synthase
VPVLKHRPTDFLVREVLVPRNCAAAAAEYEYLSLGKSGFTTMEAIPIIADAFDLATTSVTYGGLKDEDGITEQLVALPRTASTRGAWEHVHDDDRYLRLVHQGYGLEPLTIGGLEGNAFRIILRDLEHPVAERLRDIRKINFCFLNYYDIQRFGVAGGIRRTHHVGAAILESRWDDALRELVGLGAPESAKVEAWTGDAEEFFRSMDPRVPSFYLSANGSAEWNARLRALAREIASGTASEWEVEGVPFTYVANAGQTHDVLAASPDLDYRRFAFDEVGITHRDSTRPTVIQTQMSFDSYRPDEFHEGRASIEVRFFLPSGCYATAAVRQLFGRSDLVGCG